MVKIRLARKGRIKRPVYSIVAADVRCPRDGRYLEVLGQYDPMKEKDTLKQLKEESIQKWVKSGAQLTPTVKSLLKKHKVQISL